MNRTRVTVDGQHDTRPGREALPGGGVPTGAPTGARRRDGHDDPERFRSYYGQPVINAPVWEAREIAGYFFLGGLAGASSALALAADLTGHQVLARRARAGAAASIAGSLAALVADLGRPERFLHMLRVIKPTSPMSMGTWLLSGYAPAVFAAAAADHLPDGLLRTLVPGRLAGGVAAALGPAVTSYTGVLIADTAVPAWHEGWRELPFLFSASAAAAAGGFALVVGAPGDVAVARRVALAGACGEVTAQQLLEHRLDPAVRPAYRTGRAGVLLRASRTLAVAGSTAALLAGRSRVASYGAGAALMAASACTRFGVFAAGMASAADPRATVEPQRARRPARDPVPA